MQQFYKKMKISLLLLFLVSGVSLAQTGYVLTATGSSKLNNEKSAIYSFDFSDPATVLETVYTEEAEDNFGVVGTLAGNIYYAYMEESSDNVSNVTFCSLNMTTGEKVILGSGQDVTYAIDMCYDEATEKIYLLRKNYVIEDEETGEGRYVMEICTVDPKNGNIETYAIMPDEVTDYNLGGITPDGNGKLYITGLTKWTKGTGMSSWWNSYVNLYTFNLAEKELQTEFSEVEETVVNVGTTFYSSSLGMYEGKLYFTAQQRLIVIDPTLKNASLVTQTFLGEAVGICFSKSTENGDASGNSQTETDVDTRKVKIIETYGDHMGERNGITHRKVSLYDSEGKLQREATYGLTYATATAESEWQIEYFTSYHYNEAGLLTTVAGEKYGLYDGTDLGFTANEDTVTYEYNEAGQLIKENYQAKGYSILYEYDAEGHRTKEMKQLPDYNNMYEGDFYNLYEISYSSFNEFGEPDSIHSIGVQEDCQYFGAYTYDEKGRKIAEKKWASKDSIMTSDEKWTYYPEGGDTAMVYWKHEWFYGFDKGETRTVYTYDDGNTNRTKAQNQTLSDGKWINEVSYTITEMNDVVGAMTATLSVTNGKEKNSADLAISIPEAGVTGSLAFDVYRHGILLTRLFATKATEDGVLYYSDLNVKNGTYDYYVQTILVDELQETETALDISNVVRHTHYTELPAVSEIRCISARKENGIYYATIEWNAPAGVQNEELGFLRYNVMLENMKAAENAETEGNATTFEIEAGYTGKVNLYIQTVYTLGKSNSQMVTIDAQAAGIGKLVADSKTTVENDGTIHVTENADITVYNAQGALLKEIKNATEAGLHDLPAGIYLVRVKTKDGIQSVKVRK